MKVGEQGSLGRWEPARAYCERVLRPLGRALVLVLCSLCAENLFFYLIRWSHPRFTAGARTLAHWVRGPAV